MANVLVSCPQALAEEEKRAWYTLFRQFSQEFWEFETSRVSFRGGGGALKTFCPPLENWNFKIKIIDITAVFG